jgi:hypothetical protein
MCVHRAGSSSEITFRRCINHLLDKICNYVKALPQTVGLFSTWSELVNRRIGDLDLKGMEPFILMTPLVLPLLERDALAFLLYLIGLVLGILTVCWFRTTKSDVIQRFKRGESLYD